MKNAVTQLPQRGMMAEIVFSGSPLATNRSYWRWRSAGVSASWQPMHFSAGPLPENEKARDWLPGLRRL
jgi:hypothetical protein